jgi:hypothetical protein
MRIRVSGSDGYLGHPAAAKLFLELNHVSGVSTRTARVLAIA